MYIFQSELVIKLWFWL